MRPFFLTSLYATAALTLVAGCSSENTRAREAEPVRGLRVIEARRAPVTDNIEATGTVRAQLSAQLSPETMGTVREIYVTEGAHVKKEQVLAVLDSAQQSAALAQAQAGAQSAQQEIAAADAEYELADATFRRYRSMYEKKAVSPHEFDEVKARFDAAAARRAAAHSGYTQAQAATAQAQAVVSHTRLRAPFDGVVTARTMDPGSLASPSTPILTVEDTRAYRLECSVDESELRFVTMGVTVPVTIDAVPGELHGKVTQIVPAADPASHSFLVKVQLQADPNLRSGLFGRARFPRGSRDAILLPQSSVSQSGQLQSIYTVDQDKLLHLRYVTVSKAVDGTVEVISGLDPGEHVIADPGGRSLDGRRWEP